MTRGRAPNLALPLTKALAQQRDYRARKAANIARLEGENEVLRNENTQLRQDIAAYRDGRPVPDRQHDNTILAKDDASETPVADVRHSPSSAGYLQLKITYEQLEAEVQRKEQVLLSLRDKEREAFARLEALIQQSLQVVGQGTVAPPDANSHNHGIYQTTIKPEPLGHYPLPPPRDGRNVHYPPFSVPTPGSAQPLQPGVTPLSNRGSFSPESDSYRARKRVRSSSSFASGGVGSYNVATVRPYSHHTPQTYDQRTGSPFLNSEYLVPSNTHSIMQPALEDRLQMAKTRANVPPPPVSPLPNHEGGMSRRDKVEPTHSPLYITERVPPPFPLLTQPSAASFDNPRSRQLQPLPTPPITGGFFRENLSYSRPSSQPRFPLHDSTATITAASDGFGHRPWLASENQFQPPDHFSDRTRSTQSRPSDEGAADNPQNMAHNGTHESPTASANAPASLVTKTCSSSKTCRSTSECNTLVEDQDTTRSCMPSAKPHSTLPRGPVDIAESNVRELPHKVNSKEEESPSLTQANCCNGLFDCSSLPPNLWMPLHQMSTSYERGNNPAKSLASTITVLPSPADLVSGGPIDDGSTEEDSLTLPAPRMETPALKGSVERTETVKGGEAGQDEECCFGILRCEDEKPSMENS